MTKEQAIAENQKAAELLLMPQNLSDEHTKPIDTIVEDLERFASDMKNPARGRHAEVPKQMENADLLLLALTLPTEIVWSEPTSEMERDPISGNPRPKLRRVTQAAPYKQSVFAIKDTFVRTTRVFAAYAKKISSPAYAAWRELYLAMEDYYAHHFHVTSVEMEVAHDWVERFNAALFALWADNEIDKEVSHV